MSSRDEIVEALYQRYDYLRAYSEHTNLRVKDCPMNAVGGRWEEMGELQLKFLLRQGLEPQHTLLDFGCGTLRAGRLLIDYLRSRRYFGVDISKGAIDYAHQLVTSQGLSAKNPTLKLSNDPGSLAVALKMSSFDIILAQSVFTHLDSERVEHIVRCLRNLCRTGSRFYFTFSAGNSHAKTLHKNFVHPSAFFQTMAKRYEFSFRDLSAQYDHPKGQRMIEYAVL